LRAGTPSPRVSAPFALIRPAVVTKDGVSGECRPCVTPHSPSRRQIAASQSKEANMMIRTAWVETDGGFELVAAANDDDSNYPYFEENVEYEAINYDAEPLILCLTVDDDLLARLFASHNLDGEDSEGA